MPPHPHTDNIKQWQVSKVHKTFGYYVFDDILYEYIYLKNLAEEIITKDISIHIFYACDENFLKYTVVSLTSLIESTHVQNTHTSHRYTETIQAAW